MLRPAVAVLSVLLLAPLAAEAQSTKVTESDYATYRKIQYAKALAGKRADYDHKNRAKYDAEAAAAIKANGWNDEKYGEIESAIQDVSGMLESKKNGEMTDAELAEALADRDKTTVATVKAHFDELANAWKLDSEKADAQAKKERDDKAAGTPPTEAALQGTWVPDLDATIQLMGFSGKTMDDMKKTMAPTIEGSSYEFKGNTVVATAVSNGRPNVSKGTFRIDGYTIWFKDDRGKERDLTAGFQGKNLQLGKGFAKILWRKK